MPCSQDRVVLASVAPAGTPHDVIERLNSAFVMILKQPDVRQRLEAQGLEIAQDQAPEQLGAFIQAEVKK